MLGGHVRIDGRRVERAHAAVRPGMVVTLPWGQGARVLTILSLPVRRGPAPEARACYRDHDPDPRGHDHDCDDPRRHAAPPP